MVAKPDIIEASLAGFFLPFQKIFAIITS